MVFDRLSQAASYYGLSASMARGLRYLQDTDLDSLATGRYDLDGDRRYALVLEYDTKRRSDGFWEAHRRYIDIQYVQRGEELMGYVPLSRLAAGEYDEARDFLPADGEGEFLRMTAGDFAMFGPQDAHMPGMALGGPAPVRKIVLKVAVEAGA